MLRTAAKPHRSALKWTHGVQIQFFKEPQDEPIVTDLGWPAAPRANDKDVNINTQHHRLHPPELRDCWQTQTFPFLDELSLYKIEGFSFY